MTKTCPNCTKEIPDFVSRCKFCFYEYTPPPNPKDFPVLIAFLFLCISLTGFFVFKSQSQNNNKTVAAKDMSTKQLVIVKKDKAKFETTVIPFSEIEKLEYNPIDRTERKFELYAVTKTDRYLILSNALKTQLDGEKEDFGKELVLVDNASRD